VFKTPLGQVLEQVQAQVLGSLEYPMGQELLQMHPQTLGLGSSILGNGQLLTNGQLQRQTAFLTSLGIGQVGGQLQEQLLVLLRDPVLQYPTGQTQVQSKLLTVILGAGQVLQLQVQLFNKVPPAPPLQRFGLGHLQEQSSAVV